MFHICQGQQALGDTEGQSLPTVHGQVGETGLNRKHVYMAVERMDNG